MRTLLTALVKAYEIQGCCQMQNAFNAYGIDHVVLVKLASAAVVSWLLGLSETQTMASISHVWMDGKHHPPQGMGGWRCGAAGSAVGLVCPSRSARSPKGADLRTLGVLDGHL